MTDWWDQPALVRFVGSIVEPLRSGDFVHLRMPLWAPEGITEAIYRAVRDERHFERAPVHDAETTPEAWVQSRIGQTYGPEALEDFATEYETYLIVIELRDGVACEAWREFLERFHRATVQLESRRPQMVLLTSEQDLSGSHEVVPSTLVDVAYRGILDHVDMWSFARQVLEQQRNHGRGLRFSASAASVAAIAGFDPAVVEAVADVKTLDPISLAPHLEGINRARSWHALTPGVDAWAVGLEDLVDGEPVRHIASYVGSDLLDQLRVRIWDGQVRVVFPAIERRRAELVQRHSRYLRSCLDRAEDHRPLEELEFADLAHYLTADQSIGDSVMAQRLHQVRNAVAHREVVSWNQVDQIAS